MFNFHLGFLPHSSYPGKKYLTTLVDWTPVGKRIESITVQSTGDELTGENHLKADLDTLYSNEELISMFIPEDQVGSSEEQQVDLATALKTAGIKGKITLVLKKLVDWQLLAKLRDIDWSQVEEDDYFAGDFGDAVVAMSC